MQATAFAFKIGSQLLGWGIFGQQSRWMRSAKLAVASSLEIHLFRLPKSPESVPP
jgi:hypothetical protein